MGKVRQNQKDSVFRMLFRSKANLLSLYNAVNGSDYSDPGALIITTLENAIYLGMKNDLSFVIDFQLNLYEHQSSTNSNMPLRSLFYVTNVLQRLTATGNLYGSKMIMLPEPRFVVFYNGRANRPDRYDMLLSDAYRNRSENPALELRVTVLNINEGHNRELMERCPELKGFMQFSEKLREHQKTEKLDDAVEHTVDECIREGILKEFLVENKAEVKAMTIFEYDPEEHIRMEREEALAEGLEQGQTLKLIKLVCTKLQKGKDIPEIADALEEDEGIIREIRDLAEDVSPKYDAQEIYARMNRACMPPVM